jgi:hypothetical protein
MSKANEYDNHLNARSKSTAFTLGASSSKATWPDASRMRSLGKSSLSTMWSAVWTFKQTSIKEGKRRHLGNKDREIKIQAERIWEKEKERGKKGRRAKKKRE